VLKTELFPSWIKKSVNGDLNNSSVGSLVRYSEPRAITLPPQLLLVDVQDGL
jgi:hypothetical protein